MEPEVARRLFEEGALLVLLDVPVRTEVGIDCYMWQAGPRFKGVKMIPPGLHFVYYRWVGPARVSKQSASIGGYIYSMQVRLGICHSTRKRVCIV